MDWIDTRIVAGSLVTLAFVVAGFFGLRSGPRRALDPGPFWYWAFASALVAGAATEVASDGVTRIVVPPLLSPVFTALLLAGGLHYAGRRVPAWLLPVGLALGALRAGAESVGWVPASGVLSLVVEPTGALAVAWIVHREAGRHRASWVHRAMPFAFVGLACAELLGALRALFGLERMILWPLWLAAGGLLAALQILRSMERADRAEDASARDRLDRERANSRFQMLASNIREVITEVSSDGRVLWVSDSCRDELKLDAEQVVGRDFRDVLRDLQVEDVDDADAALVLGEDQDDATGTAGRRLRSRVHQLRDGDGRVRFFETRMARESPSRVLAFSRDVTDQMLAQRRLRSSEERFRKFSLLGSDYCFVAVVDAGRLVHNWMTGALEEISGYTHEELQEIGFRGFMHPDDLDDGRRRVMRLLDEGGESSHEFRIVTRGGEIRWIAESLLAEREGERVTVYGAARDITEQRRLEQAFASAQKLESLGLLAGGIAHDFNNLLMVILGSTEIALDAVGTSPAARRDLEGIVDAVEQAQSLTQQLLAYAGRGAVEHVPVDLSERVRSVSELLALAGSADVDLELDLKQGLPAVVADPGEIQQLTMNLVMNAIEACEGGGRIRVSARSAHADEVAGPWLVGDARDGVGYVVLEVRDDGVGMEADTLSRVFDPFFTTKTAGRGLGLAAVIGIVRSVDGAIRVESRPGKGTRFTVLLPASSREAVAAVAAPIASPPPCVGRVLVVDDDERVRQVAVRILRARGFEVATACDGRSAVEACRKGRYDVILLDAVMPGMTAADTFDALQATEPGVPVLMVSGFDMERAAGDLLERGLAGFVGKPFRAAELVARIGALIDGASPDGSQASERGDRSGNGSPH